MATKKQQTYTLQDALQQMITNYNNAPTWKARTAAERQKIAQDEYKSLYDQYRLNAQQAYDKSDLALQQQRSGIADTYNQQREASAQEYRNAYSQADRNLLGRGMGRSSYGLQTLANIGNKAAEAQQAIWDAQSKAEMNVDQQRALAAQQLAEQIQQYGNSEASDAQKYARQLEEQDYERGLQGAQYQNQLFGQIYNAIAEQEQNEQEQAWREKEFDYAASRDAENDRRYNEEFAYKKERDIIGDQERADERNYNRERDLVNDKRYDEEFAYKKERDLVGDAKDTAALEYQKARDLVGDNQWQQQYDFNREQFNVGNEQWQKELEEQIRQFNVLHPEANKTATAGGGGGYTSTKKSSGTGGTNPQATQEQKNEEFWKGLGLGENGLTLGGAINAIGKGLNGLAQTTAEARNNLLNTMMGKNPNTKTTTTTTPAKTNTTTDNKKTGAKKVPAGLSYNYVK